MAKQVQLTTLKQVIAYCLKKPGAWLDDPWGGGHNVTKVADKMFMMAGAVQDEPAIAVRCIDLEDRQHWRDRYPDDIGPQPYMVHQPWNRVVIGRAVSSADLQEMIDISYDNVVSRLPKSKRPADWVPLAL